MNQKPLICKENGQYSDSNVKLTTQTVNYKSQRRPVRDSNGEISPKFGLKCDEGRFESLEIKSNCKVDKGVMAKVKAIEKDKVQRSKVVLSPYKKKKKEISEKMLIKVRKFNEVVDKGDTKNEDIKEVKNSKKNKIDSNDKMNVERIKLLKETLFDKEDKMMKGVELDAHKTNDNTEVVKSKEREKVVNAFEVLMESKDGGKIRPITPKRIRKRKIGSKSKTPTSSSKNSLMEWLKK